MKVITTEKIKPARRIKGSIVPTAIRKTIKSEVRNICDRDEKGKFTKSKFYTDEIKGKIHAYSNFQFKECTVTDVDLKLDNEMAFEKRDNIIVVDASNQKLRIAGVFSTI